MAAVSSKKAQAYLIDPMNAPEPSAETGPGTHFGSTFAPATANNSSAIAREASLKSKNPYSASNRKASPPTKVGVSTRERAVSAQPHERKVSGARRSSGSPREHFPNYRAEAFGEYEPASHHSPSHEEVSAGGTRHRRRTSSLRERFPGDDSVEPLKVLRSDSKKANRSPHLNKRHIPGADLIDRLDPALGGRAYHHEGPFDAALLARNTSFESSPLAALKTSNEETLKATPKENIRDAVDRHKPLDGVATVPAGFPDRLGRTYEYEEGADMMHEPSSGDAGYKRWPGETYSKADLKGHSEPGFSLDTAMQAHKITDDSNNIELQERSGLMQHKIDDAQYAEEYYAATKDSDAGKMGGLERKGSLREGIKKRIGSLRRRKGLDE